MTFAALTEADRQGFAGAGEGALIAEGPICNEHCVVVVDDNRIEVFAAGERNWFLVLEGAKARECALVAKGLFQALRDSLLDLTLVMERFGFNKN